ncbi:MAG: response regulator transcription factor, partial [Chromatiales bacterium]
SQPLVRKGLFAILSATRGFEVVGEVGTASAMLSDMEALKPDAAIVDPALDGSPGHQVLAELQERFPDVSVIVLTSACSDLSVIECLRSGAQGFLTKNASAETIVQALRAIAAGDSYLDPSVTSTVVGAVGRHNDRRRSNARQLTQRERAVLELLVEGKRNKAISEALHISERTVKFHVRALFQKLRASNRTEAVMAAVAQGLASPTTGKSS